MLPYSESLLFCHAITTWGGCAWILFPATNTCQLLRLLSFVAARFLKLVFHFSLFVNVEYKTVATVPCINKLLVGRKCILLLAGVVGLQRAILEFSIYQSSEKCFSHTLIGFSLASTIHLQQLMRQIHILRV